MKKQNTRNMAFERDYINFHYCKIDSEGKVRVYKDMTHYNTLNNAPGVVAAAWLDDAIITKHEDETLRYWTSFCLFHYLRHG